MSSSSMRYDTQFSLPKTLALAADLFSDGPVEPCDFQTIDWSPSAFIARGQSGGQALRVRLDFDRLTLQLIPSCSRCGSGEFCPHSRALLRLLNESDIASEVEDNGYAPCTFTLRQSTAESNPDAWKTKLLQLGEQLRFLGPADTLPAKFPAGKQAMYVIQADRYSAAGDAMEILVATRLADGQSPPNRPGKSASRKRPGTMYRNFTGGVRALAASPDPTDREIAEKISLITGPHLYDTRQQIRFTIWPETAGDLIGRLASAGRLLLNTEYALHDGLTPVGWLGDDPFEVKFQITGRDAETVSLGLCVVGGQVHLPQQALQTVSSWFFIDDQHRLGLFRRRIAEQLFRSFRTSKPIVVAREQAPELIEQVMNLPVGLGLEFLDCEEVRPLRIDSAPRPRIHLKASSPFSETIEAELEFDYEGVRVPLERPRAEFYDKTRGAIVRIDAAAHEASVDLLISAGVKVSRDGVRARLSLKKNKVPGIVATLIQHGWHVEADGKLYRTGSRFEMKLVSGVDWFELQGRGEFEGTGVDLPRLLQALRAGERSVVLDDGSIGLLPEEWIRRLGGVADLASGGAEGDAIRFGRSQVGVLDALLAEQGAVDVDEKFIAARQALQGFDRIQPLAPPEGFVGTLRPYQQLALGWFEFLRQLGFGGCLADEMGLGKTVQVLAMLEQRRQLKSGPSLVVVPRSLVFNWIAEVQRFAPQMRVLDQSHAQRRKETEHLADFDLVVTTYGTLRRDAAFLKDFEFDYVILDEAQAIKNAGTEAAKAARLLNGRHRLALSGTPIENHLGELWSLFDFLNPGMLGRVGRFTNLTQDAGDDSRKLLAAAVRPFILRRTKKQVAPELPDRVEQTILVELDPEQRQSYDQLRDYYRQALMSKIEADGIGKSQIIILEALLRLRQAACHPGLIDKARAGEPSAKLDELISRLSSAVEEKERVLVFSQFTSFLAIVAKRLKQAKLEFLYLDGKTKNRQALVDQFQSGTGPAIFLISLKAGGVGLNLTAARTVYLLDPWWNPAVEAQAIDRSHRIGQHQVVFATRLIAADTVEQKVLELQAKKKGLADAIVNVDNGGISSLSREDLELLLA